MSHCEVYIFGNFSTDISVAYIKQLVLDDGNGSDTTKISPGRVVHMKKNLNIPIQQVAIQKPGQSPVPESYWRQPDEHPVNQESDIKGKTDAVELKISFQNQKVDLADQVVHEKSISNSADRKCAISQTVGDVIYELENGTVNYIESKCENDPYKVVGFWLQNT